VGVHCVGCEGEAGGEFPTAVTAGESLWVLVVRW